MNDFNFYSCNLITEFDYWNIEMYMVIQSCGKDESISKIEIWNKNLWKLVSIETFWCNLRSIDCVVCLIRLKDQPGNNPESYGKVTFLVVFMSHPRLWYKKIPQNTFSGNPFYCKKYVIAKCNLDDTDTDCVSILKKNW